MPSAPRSSNSGYARELVKACQRELEESGFRNRKGTTLWRRTNLKFDILEFDIIPKARCEKWDVPPGSFRLEPSCLFPFLPPLGLGPGGKIPRPEKDFGQVRLSIRRGIRQRSIKVPNVWWAGDSAGGFDEVMKDVLAKITGEILPFYSRFDDAEELLRTFLEDDNAFGREGVWDFGNRGSVRRLLYTGFAAIECGDWDLAISSLRDCRAKTMEIEELVREQIEAEILPYVDIGLSCAERKTAWTMGL